MRRDSRPQFVVRVDTPKLHGWQVRIPAWHPQGPGSKLFSDSLHGGADAALVKANAFRDEVFAGMPSPGHPSTHRTNTRGSTGIVGVTLSSRTRPGRPTHWYWEAYWNDSHGTQKKKRFSIRKLGYLPAWEQAVACREQKTNLPLNPGQYARARLNCLQRWASQLSASGLPLNTP